MKQRDLISMLRVAKSRRAITENLDHPAHGTAKGYDAGCRCYRCKKWKGEPPVAKENINKLYPDYVFNFPLNNRAKNTSLIEQHQKIAEEFKEIGYELYCDGKPRIDTDIDTDRVLEETLDLIHAAEGILRKFAWSEVQHAFDVVLAKNDARGDYDDCR